MKVSVIIPCYNQAKFLSDAIKSVQSQSYSNWEAIIINDGSTDNIDEIIASLDDNRIIYIKQENHGLANARNRGLSEATGDLIQFLDADDMITSYKFESQIEGLKKNNADISISGYLAFKHPDVTKGVSTNTELNGESPLHEFVYRWEKGLCIPIHCFLYRKYVIDEVGGFREDLPDHEDWDFHLRVSINYYHYIHDPTQFALYRTHDKSICRNTDMSKGKSLVTSFYAVCKQMPEEMRDYFRKETLKIYPDHSFQEPTNIIVKDRINLTMVTFVFIVRIDSEERLNNLDFCVYFLQSHFWTNIIIAENDEVSKIEGRYRFVNHIFVQDNKDVFHKTKFLNDIVKEHVKTDWFCRSDIDVFVNPETILKAVGLLDSASLVYPFNGIFYDIPNYYALNKALKTKDIKKEDCAVINPNSYGGAVFFRTNDFIKGGMDNEKVIGWGHEDNERYMRFAKLGYRVLRTQNPIYHFTHPRDINGGSDNPHYSHNVEEYNKMCFFTKEEILNYIKNEFTWL